MMKQEKSDFKNPTYPELLMAAAICDVLFPGAAQASRMEAPCLMLLMKTGKQLAWKVINTATNTYTVEMRTHSS